MKKEVSSSIRSKELASPLNWGGELTDEVIDLHSTPMGVFDDDVAWTIDDVCNYFGGSKPINPATIYTWIKKKGFPDPYKPGPQTSRWLKSEVVAYRRNIIHERKNRRT